MIITLIIIYLVSVIWLYKVTQKIVKTPTVIHFVFLFIPIVNTIFSIILTMNILADEIDWNKFESLADTFISNIYNIVELGRKTK